MMFQLFFSKWSIIVWTFFWLKYFKIWNFFSPELFRPARAVQCLRAFDHHNPAPSPGLPCQIPAQISVISRKYAKIPLTSPEGCYWPYSGVSQRKRIKVWSEWKLTQILGIFFRHFGWDFRQSGPLYWVLFLQEIRAFYGVFRRPNPGIRAR